MAREKKAAEALENFDKTKASWWDSPEYKAAAKEHRSAVRQRRKALKDGKAILAAAKK